MFSPVEVVSACSHLEQITPEVVEADTASYNTHMWLSATTDW